MRTKRLILFILMIAVGLGLGLVYGWIISPVQYINTGGEALRSDYKADYVLMVAEIYASDGMLDQADYRLRLLGSQPAEQIVSEAIATAVELEYAPEDLALMNQLAQALAAQPTVESTGELP